MFNSRSIFYCCAVVILFSMHALAAPKNQGVTGVTAPPKVTAFSGGTTAPTANKSVGDTPALTKLPSAKLRPTGAPTALPRTIGPAKFKPVHVPSTIGRSLQSIGGAGRALEQQNNLGRRLPAGHGVPAAGFDKRSGADAFAKEIGTQGSIGKASDTFSDELQPRLAIGRGATSQNDDVPDDTGDPAYDHFDAYDPKPSSDEITFEEEDMWPWVLLEEEADSSDHAGDTESKPSKEEVKTVDGGLDGSPDGRHIAPDRVKSIFAGSPGIRFAPGEEGGTGEGPVDPGRLGAIQGSHIQVHTFEDGVPRSVDFNNLSRLAQENIENGGVPTASD